MAKVFISYSHDSDAHRERVLALSERLREDGIETILDQYVNGSPSEGWPRWMLNQLDVADFVLVVCTETYYRRFRGHEVPGKGKGADWEGALITQEIYDHRSATVKFIPVLFTAEDEPFIPEPLRRLTHYTANSEPVYQNLCDFILGAAGVEPRPVGDVKQRTRRQGTPLKFNDGNKDTIIESATNKQRIADTRLTHAVEKLIGREVELQRLDEAWKDSKQHVLIIRGIGGEGKTSLVADWVSRLALRNYDAASYFDWSFYSQGTRDQTNASSDSFIAAALEFFGGDEGKRLANSAASGRDKATKLLAYLRGHRTLLVLDGLEPLQHPPGPLGGQLRDDAMAALLKGLAQNSPGLCVVTTREPVTDLARFQDTTAPEWELRELSEITGAALLQRLLEPKKPRGVHRVPSSVEERKEISRAVKGHALTLRILGGFIHRALRDVRKWREVDYTKADLEYKTNPKDSDSRYGHAFKTIEAYEKWLESGGQKGARQLAVLRLLGLFDRPANGDLLAALRAPPAIPGLTDSLVALNNDDWNTVLSELEECGLVSLPKSDSNKTDSCVDAHPLLREYFARQLRTQQLDAWRAAHRRLYEHLCATTPDKPQPTLEDLQPLYQAVAHGCQAGLQQKACDDVYFARIARRNENYSSKKLGAFGSDLGAVACFFEQPWSHLSLTLTEADQSWMLNEAATRLRALGRLTESLEPMRISGEMDANVKRWKGAAASYSNLSELELTLGEVTVAVGDAEQSVTYADRSGDAFERMSNRTTHADALHQAGRWAKAEARFREAQQMQSERQPDYSLLYGVAGFRYCDLLLAAPERAAWQTILGRAELPLGPDIGAAQQRRPTETDIESCRAVSQRAAQTFKWAEQNRVDILSAALDHLTLGRAALYAAILERSAAVSERPAAAASTRQSAFDTSSIPSAVEPAAGGPADTPALQTARRELDAAVDGLRRAGQVQELPRGLLTRAWLRFLTSAHTGRESAQEDLDEAWEIAERGHMKLCLADIHLYRARLFGTRNSELGVRNEETKYPWESPEADLKAAEKLINACGYHRRDEELADAMKAILGS